MQTICGTEQCSFISICSYILYISHKAVSHLVGRVNK